MSESDQSKTIIVKTPEEIEIMYRANQIVAGVLSLLEERIRPGLTTLKLDRWAEEYCRDHGSEPAFKGYRGFPGSLCVSINEQVVHGIPSKKVVIREGDIVSVDFGVRYQGFYGDSAITIPVGEISPLKRRLLEVTRESLEKAIAQVKVGNRIADISRAVQTHAEQHGFSVVRHFVGHGIGTSLHEGPEVPNYVQKQPSPRILEGMVVAIEPMVNAGTHKVKVLADRWTVVTADRKPSAHFEHSVAATKEGPLVLSAREKAKK
ncbi:type I methionyl aminopeptidase [Desulfolithobacter dissulfuricans]|uniref:Methionine aminopeptidase n=1 Tax=Desulfolithobacter dissulfuricans TaxID=2795293 RepID=A0A915UAU2_9BACT|nr:type I methionyl aminopeptidase [Desulfolithobacter dissulfuricans]BCO09950.1 type I methionyl aminopeptidase [Desulfolithobacter dissulfuricans]